MGIFRQLRITIPGVTSLRIDIIGFAGEYFPGFVHCAFADANGKRHTFIEKIPIVTTLMLWSDSSYPQPGMVPCDTVEVLQDESQRSLALVSISVKGSMDSPYDSAQFVVLESQLSNDF